MWSLLLEYEFSATDSQFIKRIETIQPQLCIDTLYINGKEDSTYNKLPITQLQTVLDKRKEIMEPAEFEKAKIKISSRMPAFRTIQNILPRFQSQVDNISEEDQKRLEKDVGFLVDNLVDSTFASAWSPDNRYLPNVHSKEDLWKVIHLAHAKMQVYAKNDIPPFFSVCDSPSRKEITIYSILYTFHLTYDDKKQNLIGKGEYPGLHLESGLHTNYGCVVIRDELKTAFEKWKQNGQHGTLIFSSHAGSPQTEAQPKIAETITQFSPLYATAIKSEDPADLSKLSTKGLSF
ncbi:MULTISPECIES: hypothetical protein [Legionella]|uniref:Uncharacterized protein n=1 Tax=Legionella maceachernii TaxID=466 RepID=A0A0W0VZX5_9GAMM|nr:hypothetical protein [Legionella maceachernii]KTD25615.1 hypothetical protein Lmac_1979 [Legionella maceachernii]SJZ57607.1 hypothetical protein SAMN02745128_00470 [Legionella maceachernii]SUP00641.1 Uncharacterised protein [Legionella maceachernii]